jgi:hypothetical protein
MRFCPAQVHPQDHIGPILRLRAAGTGLDVHERVAVIQIAAEHSPELERINLLFEFRQVAHDNVDRCTVILVDRHLQYFVGVAETRRQRIQYENDFFELSPFLPESLCPARVVPHIRLFEFPLNFGQSFRLSIVVKGTPLTPMCAPTILRFVVRSDWFPFSIREFNPKDARYYHGIRSGLCCRKTNISALIR